jgi:nucleoside transporter
MLKRSLRRWEYNAGKAEKFHLTRAARSAAEKTTFRYTPLTMTDAQPPLQAPDDPGPTPVLSYQPFAAPTPSGIGIRLGVMMFLQYAVWGIWLPVMANYLGAPVVQGGLGFTGAQIGWILGLAGAMGAIGAPFIAGQVADRVMNAERALAGLLLIGGALNIGLAFTHEYKAFLMLSIAYSVVYMPTLSLTNSIAFQNLDDAERRFPPIRLWGTVGWIAASNAFTLLWLNTSDDVTNTRRIAHALLASGVISFAYAAYALIVLPKTPPKRDQSHPLAFARAFALLGKPAFLIATLIALPIAMIHQCYFFRAGPFFEQAVGVSKSGLGPVMSIGQFSEIGFLIILGLLIKRLGYKWVLVLGTLAYAVRFGIFAMGHPPAVVITSQVLHGLCYGCFFAGSFLLVERLAPADIRHSAQTVFGIIILGLGPIMAGFYNQFVLGRFEKVVDGVTHVNYHGIWLTQSLIAAFSMLVLIAIFPRVNAGEPRVATA